MGHGVLSSGKAHRTPIVSRLVKRRSAPQPEACALRSDRSYRLSVRAENSDMNHRSNRLAGSFNARLCLWQPLDEDGFLWGRGFAQSDGAQISHRPGFSIEPTPGPAEMCQTLEDGRSQHGS